MTNPITDDEGTFTEEERELIGREAAKLKREFEAERNKRRGISSNSRNQSSSAHPGAQTSIYGDPLAEETERSLLTLRDLDKQLQDSMNKKQQSLKELSSVQDALRRNKSELKRAERDLMETSRKFDADKSEVVTLEKQRDCLRKEIREFEDKVANSKRMYSNTLEMNTSEILNIIDERDTLKRKLASGEATLGYVERLEFERQISIAKDELFAEQRSSRMRIDALQEELDQALRKVDDSEMSNAELHAKMSAVERESKDKQSASGELADLLRHEIKDLKNQVDDLKTLQTKINADLHDREKNVQELQHLLVEKEKEISYEHDQRSKLLAEKNFEISSLKDSHEKALLVVQEKAEIEKKSALSENEDRNDEERQELLRKQENRIADMEADHIRQLDNKEQEISYYKEKLRQQEEATRELGERLRLEAQEQVRSAIAREKNLWEDEHSRLLKRERNSWDDELARTQARLNEAIEYEKSQVASAQKTICSLRKEVDEIRCQNKELHKEATSAMLTAREAVQQDHQDQLSSLRHQLVEERDLEVNRLSRQISELQDEVAGLRSNLDNASARIQSVETSFDHHEKTIVLEVNDECKKVAHVVGLHPRKVNVDKYDRKCRGLLPTKQIQRTPITDSLANLRACVSELVNYVNGLREAIDSLKLKCHHLKEEKDQELKTVKDHFEMEKDKELEKVKEKHFDEIQGLQAALHKESDVEAGLRKELRAREDEIGELKTNMSKWKEETASKIAREIEREVENSNHTREEYLNQQKLIIRMEDQISRLQAEQALGRPGYSDSSSVKLLRHLQDRVRMLKLENAKLRSSDETFSAY